MKHTIQQQRTNFWAKKSTARKPKKPRRDLEHEDQVRLFTKLKMEGWLEAYPIFAIPNGGARHKVVGVKLKAEGVTAGVPDIFVATPKHGYHGMFIEMKRPYSKKSEKNDPSPSQAEMMKRLSDQGYICVVANGFDEAWRYLKNYLSLK